MKRRILSIMLSFLMVFCSLPTSVFAEETGLAETGCTICSVEGCTGEHTFCEECNEYDCGIDHAALIDEEAEAPVCSCSAEDGAVHTATCPAYTCPECGIGPWHETCAQEDPGEADPVYCETCEEYDCGIDHGALIDEEEGAEAPICSCSAEEGAVHAATCPAYTCPECGIGPWHETCAQEEPGEADPVYCETCEKYDCGIDHSLPTEEELSKYPFYANVKKLARFDLTYSQFPVVADPTDITASEVFGSDIALSKDVIPEDLIVRIEQCYVNEAEDLYWYRITAADGYTLPEEFCSPAWVFQDNISYSGGSSLIILEGDPCSVCGVPGCTTQHVLCEICLNYDCKAVHFWCEHCEKYDCGKAHVVCPACGGGVVDCEKTHVYCPYCGEFDCGEEHEDPYAPVTEPVIPEDPELTPGEDVSIADEFGNAVTASGYVILDGVKSSLSAWTDDSAESYQWQVCYNNNDMLWADIYGQTDKAIIVSAAMFLSIIDYQAVTYLRCVATKGNEIMISQEIPITVEEALPVEQVAVFAMSKASSEAAMAGEPQATSSEITYPVTVVYEVKETGAEPPSPWVANLAAGANYILDIVPPEMPGYYAGDINGDPIERVTETINNIQSSITFHVYYWPDYVSYKVNHYQQKIGDDHYDLVDIENFDENSPETQKRRTGEAVGSELAKTYTGFDTQPYDTTITVAADGSTEVNIYYDRQYFMIAVDLNGGYGAEPVFARYETPITIPTPKRTGYTFAGWKNKDSGNMEDIVATVPAQRMEYVAQWTEATAYYTVAFYYENANDDGYTFVGSSRKSGTTGTPVSGTLEDYEAAEFKGKDVTNFKRLNTEKTDKNVILKADGTTVVGVYLYRETYTLTYYRWKCLHSHPNAACCSITEHTEHNKDCISNMGSKVTNSNNVSQLNSNTPNATNGSWGYFEVKIGSWVLDTYYCVYWGGTWYHLSGTDESINWGGCPGMHTHGYGCNANNCSHTPKWHCETDYSNRNHWTKVYQANLKYEADTTQIHLDMLGLRDGTPGLASGEYGLRWVPHGIEGFAGWNGDNTGSGTAVGAFTSMTSGNATFYEGGDGSYKFEIQYWLEGADGKGTRAYKATGDTQTHYFNKGTLFKNQMGNVAWKDEFFNGTPLGFEQYEATYGSEWGADTYILSEGQNQNAYLYNNFYYIRKVFKVEYRNGEESVTTRDMRYEQQLTSEYNLALNALTAEEKEKMVSPDGPGYEFAGWYLDSDGTVPVKFDGSITMPNAGTKGTTGLALYAKWTPIQYTVKTYTTKDDIGGTPINTYSISHGDIYEGTVAIPYNEGLNFIGWFYEEDGEEVAYDFSMPVYRSMNLYGKWSSNVVTTGRIYYKDTAGNELVRFVDVTGLVGDTKTYSAKLSSELGDGETLYFPNVTSHSIKFSSNPDQNTFTFVYTALPEVGYTIRFVDKDNFDKDDPSKDLLPPVTGTSKTATITYDAPEKDKYYPDKNSKEFALSSDPDLNVFYFYYTYDPDKATVQVIHYTENLDGTGYEYHSESQSTVEELGTVITAADRKVTINGFTYDHGTFNNGAASTSHTLTGGTIIRLYYTRNSYPYEFRFVYKNAQGNEVEFPNSAITGNTAKYRETVSQDAKPFAGYKPDANSKSIVIDYHDNANVRTFVYTEEDVKIYYRIGAVAGGTIDVTEETVKAINGVAQGSTATVDPSGDYIFTGWYDDYACTQQVANEDALTFVPQKDGDIWVLNYYYAGFKEVEATIEYKVEMPQNAKGTATLTTASENVAVLTGNAGGSAVDTIPAGYELDGWYDAGGNKLSTSESFVPTKPGTKWVSAVYTAKFVEKKATINYVAVGYGTVTPASEPVDMVTGVAVGATAAEAEDISTLVGWYADAACEGTILSTNAVFVPTMPTDGWAETQTYYAKFESIEYTISFENRENEPEIDIAEIKYFCGSNVTIPTAVSEDNYVVLTWTVKENAGSWVKDTVVSIGNIEELAAYGNVTLVANWTISAIWIDADNAFVSDASEIVDVLDMQENIPYGKEHVYNGELTVNGLEARRNTVQHTYKFDQWVKEDLSQFGDALKGIVVYRASYTSTENLCTITIVTDCSDSNQSFIFNITNGTVSLQVAMGAQDEQTIVGLPAGTYTITDQSDWSWRYDPKKFENQAIAGGESKKFEFEYKSTSNPYWLNGYGNEQITVQQPAQDND